MNTASLALSGGHWAFRMRRHDLVREPCAGNPHARFDERGLETWSWEPDCGPERKRRTSHRTLKLARQSSTLPRTLRLWRCATRLLLYGAAPQGSAVLRGGRGCRPYGVPPQDRRLVSLRHKIAALWRRATRICRASGPQAMTTLCRSTTRPAPCVVGPQGRRRDAPVPSGVRTRRIAACRAPAGGRP